MKYLFPYLRSFLKTDLLDAPYKIQVAALMQQPEFYMEHRTKRVALSQRLLPRDLINQVCWQLIDSEANLGHTIALANRHSLVFQRLEIDGNAERCPDLVLPAIRSEE